MHLTVRSIDFAKRAISLEIGRSISMSHFDHLRNYLDYCATLGYANIDIFYPTHMPVMAFVMLQQLQTRRVKVSSSNPVKSPETLCSSCEFQVVRPSEDSQRPVEYRVSCINPDKALDHLTSAVSLLGASVPLDETSLSYLRLSVYELAANSLEHGEFTGKSPIVTVSLSFTDTDTIVNYRDNAEPFSTATERTIDVGAKIRNRSKRGLGLFLLQKITEDLDYQRVGAENSTCFKIERQDKARNDFTRRTDMNTLSITTMPTRSADTVVIKPAGSINSTTVPHLDAAFSQARTAGHKTLVIDLSETDFVSSSGVGLLLGTVAALREQDGDLVLMSIPKLVSDIFDILNIKMHFRVVNSLSELEAAVKS